MDKLLITGKKELKGEIFASGAKPQSQGCEERLTFLNDLPES